MSPFELHTLSTSGRLVFHASASPDALVREIDMLIASDEPLLVLTQDAPVRAVEAWLLDGKAPTRTRSGTWELPVDIAADVLASSRLKAIQELRRLLKATSTAGLLHHRGNIGSLHTMVVRAEPGARISAEVHGPPLPRA